MKILIADDDARMRQILNQVIAGLASDVWEASDGTEAVAICAAQRPDWVFMDWRMKPMDGLHATARIKARFPDARIIIVSQYDDAEFRVEAARAGACGYVLKENLQELRELLAADSAERNAGKTSSGPVPPLAEPH